MKINLYEGDVLEREYKLSDYGLIEEDLPSDIHFLFGIEYTKGTLYLLPTITQADGVITVGLKEVTFTGYTGSYRYALKIASVSDETYNRTLVQSTIYVSDSIMYNGESFVPENSLISLDAFTTEVYTAIDLKENLLPDGTADYFLTVDEEGTKTWKQVAVGAGGFAPNLYPTNIDSEVIGYKELSYTPDADEVEISTNVSNETVLVQEYLYPEQVGVTSIPEGRWSISFINKVSSRIGVSNFVVQFFARHIDNTETNLFDAVDSSEINHTDYEQCGCEFIQQAIPILATDRLGFKIYAKSTSNNRILYYKTGGANATYITTPSELRHDLLRDKNGNSDYLHVTEAQIAKWDALEARIEALENL